MGFIGILLLVIFVIVSLLLILLVLVQNEDGDSIGGIFAGGSSSAFGSRSGNVLTRTTGILGALFLVVSFGLALANKTPSESGVEAAARSAESQASGDWWAETPAATDNAASTDAQSTDAQSTDAQSTDAPASSSSGSTPASE